MGKTDARASAFFVTVELENMVGICYICEDLSKI